MSTWTTGLRIKHADVDVNDWLTNHACRCWRERLVLPKQREGERQRPIPEPREIPAPQFMCQYTYIIYSLESVCLFQRFLYSSSWHRFLFIHKCPQLIHHGPTTTLKAFDVVWNLRHWKSGREGVGLGGWGGERLRGARCFSTISLQLGLFWDPATTLEAALMSDIRGWKLDMGIDLHTTDLWTVVKLRWGWSAPDYETASPLTAQLPRNQRRVYLERTQSDPPLKCLCTHSARRDWRRD